MLTEVPRFHRAARRLLDTGDPVGQTFANFLRTGGFSRYFTAHFALPLVAAVWSCPTGTALRYPARYLFAETLKLWREQFGAHAAEVADLGFDEVFNRMWKFYLCYSEAGFRAGYIGVSQLTLART